MEYMIKMLRELDATSSGSIDGAVYNDLRCIARRFSETEVLGRPREVMADLRLDSLFKPSITSREVE